MARSSSSLPDITEQRRLKIKDLLHKNAIVFIDAGLKPNMLRKQYFRKHFIDAVNREYARRLRLEIETYPPQRTKKYTKSNLLQLSWKQLEKLKRSLGRRTTKRRKRKRRGRSRKIRGRKVP